MSKSLRSRFLQSKRVLQFGLIRSDHSRRHTIVLAAMLVCLAGLMAMTYLMVAPRPGEISPIIRTLRQQFTGGYVLHITAYCVMSTTALWMCSVVAQRFKNWVLAILVIHATASEVAQIWIPTRSWDMWDIVCNLSGVLVGLLIFDAVRSLQSIHLRQTSIARTDA